MEVVDVDVDVDVDVEEVVVLKLSSSSHTLLSMFSKGFEIEMDEE